MKDKIKIVKKMVRRSMTRKNIIKVVTIISGALLILTSVLPYIV